MATITVAGLCISLTANGDVQCAARFQPVMHVITSVTETDGANAV